LHAVHLQEEIPVIGFLLGLAIKGVIGGGFHVNALTEGDPDRSEDMPTAMHCG